MTNELLRIPIEATDTSKRWALNRFCGFDGRHIVNSAYFFTPEIVKEIEIPQKGILSTTLYEDADVTVVLFGFAAGNELSAHTAPMPAVLYFLQGEADLTLGADTQAVKAGAFAHMPPHLNHAILAKTALIMLLLKIKGLRCETIGPAGA